MLLVRYYRVDRLAEYRRSRQNESLRSVDLLKTECVDCEEFANLDTLPGVP